MRRFRHLSVLMISALLMVSATEPSQVAKVAAATQEKDRAGWINLLPGKDLAKHWDTKGNWVLGDDGVLAFTPGKDKGPANTDQHLWSKEQFKDFEAEFEFKLANKVKDFQPHAAFVFHVPDPTNYLKQGIRVMIQDHGDPARGPWGHFGEIRVGPMLNGVPTEKLGKPAEAWNTMRVLVQGKNVTVFLNGEEINKLARPHSSLIADQPVTGAIGFEKFAVPIWLRNLRVRKVAEALEMALKPGLLALKLEAMALSADGQRLLVVHDEEIRVWATATGELERVWPMMPRAHGRFAALSPDGKTAAVTHGTLNGFWLLDVATGNHRLVIHPNNIGGTQPQFSADGLRVFWGAALWDVQSGRLTHVVGKGTFAAATLSPDGKQMCIVFNNGPPAALGAKYREEACVFDLLPPSGAGANPTELVQDKSAPENQGLQAPQGPRFALETWPNRSTLIGWAPDGSRLASYSTVDPKTGLGTTDEIHLWTADGKHERSADGQGFRTIKLPSFGPLKFVDADHLLLDLGTKNVQLVDLKTGKLERKGGDGLGTGQRVFSGDGKLAAIPVSMFEGSVRIYNLDTGKEVRLSQSVPPRWPGWGPDSRTLAWSRARDNFNVPDGVIGKNKRAEWAGGLIGGLDLSKLEILRGVQLRGFQPSTRPKGWIDRGPRGKFTVIHDMQVYEMGGIDRDSWNVARDAEGNPLIVGVATGKYGIDLSAVDCKTGKSTATPLPPNVYGELSSVSPDRRFGLLRSVTSHETFVYRLDRKPTHLLTIHVSGTDWVAWTPQGYYAATPGGERLIGLIKLEQPRAPLTFYPIDRFRNKLYRPDIIKLVLEKGSVEEAIKVANGEAGIEKAPDVKINDLLPPRAVLSLLQQEKAAVKLKVEAEAAVKDQPVTALRLLVDGRPLADGSAQEKFTDGKKQAAAQWSITLPPGKHLLAVLARSPDASSRSNSIEVEVADPAKVHALHVLAIGVNDYEDSTLKLDFAAKDAQDIASGFQKSRGELFQSVHGEVLINAKARKDAILKQLAELRKKAGPSDLAVIFFAGHGVKQKDKFYLLSVEAKSDNLPGTAISGDELRKALGEFPCQVLLMLDACHASAGLKNFRPAVDDITRNLTDDDCGVAVMCAAMAHEKALEKGGNGLFTRAVVQALGRAEGVPYNRHNRLLFVHHLQAFVYDEVSQQSGDRQHPFLSLPWVVESFPVARFPSARRRSKIGAEIQASRVA